MSKLEWDKAGERIYETGVDRVALFPLRGGQYQPGVAWNGVTAINESPSGAEATALYADNMKYLRLMSAEELGYTIEAYGCPEEFRPCVGELTPAAGVTIGQQAVTHFGLIYRTLVGNDTEGTDYGYKLRVLFNCLASPTDKNHETVNENPDPASYSWDVSTIPVDVPGRRPTSAVTLESEKLRKAGLANVLRHLEDLFYGTASSDPTFLTVTEMLEVYEQEMYLRDSDGEAILDSAGEQFRTRVFA